MLPRHKNSLDMVAGLLNRELTDPALPDVILFLGASGLAYNRAAAKAVRAQQKIAPLIFYIEYIGPVRYRQAGGASASAINRVRLLEGHRITVAALKGKTLLVQRPLDFAKALEEVVSAVNKRRR